MTMPTSSSLDLQTTDSFRLYLDEIGRHPLLSAEDEVELNRSYAVGAGCTIEAGRHQR